jgi:hypothetical protein
MASRSPKSQQVQSGECSNVAAGCSSHDREDTTCMKILELAGLIWLNEAAPSLRSNIPQIALVATLDTYDVIPL